MGTIGRTDNRTGSYSKADRILKRREFEALQTAGEKLYTKFFLISVRPSPSGRSRLGITVTKKVSPKAVERNRVKRRVREFFRKNRAALRSPLDIVVIARRDAMLCSLTEITRTFLGALGKHGFLNGR